MKSVLLLTLSLFINNQAIAYSLNCKTAVDQKKQNFSTSFDDDSTVEFRKKIGVEQDVLLIAAIEKKRLIGASLSNLKTFANKYKESTDGESIEISMNTEDQEVSVHCQTKL